MMNKRSFGALALLIVVQQDRFAASFITGRYVSRTHHSDVLQRFAEKSDFVRKPAAIQVDGNDDSMIVETDNLIEDTPEGSIFEQAAKAIVGHEPSDDSSLKSYAQVVTLLRILSPAVLAGSVACAVYPGFSLYLSEVINDAGAFDVIANDYSQYIQNILTTCGLTFSILTGYTYYFLYQQQEAVFTSLFEEVNVAKTLLEQISLVSQGRVDMYRNILTNVDRYVREDLTQFAVEPSVLLSSRPIDDPLEDIMYLTSVGKPSIIYQTVRALRQARSRRLGALQRKLPQIQFVLLWSLAGVVCSTFPVLGAGVQTLGGYGILKVQSYYMGFIVFGINVAMGVLNELDQPAGKGAYSAIRVLSIMVEGLEKELEGRQSGTFQTNKYSPSIDGGLQVSIEGDDMPFGAATIESDSASEG